MAYFEITGSGTGAYDGEKEGIWFKHDTVESLVFTRLGNDLKITGQFDGNDFEYTITNFDFSSSTYDDLFNGAGEAVELDTITDGYQINYTADSDFAKSAYNWNITVADGTDAENYTTISVSGLGAGDTLSLDGTKSKTWSDDDKNKLVVTDDTHFKQVTITDYFSNPVNAYYPPSGNLDVTLACDTPYVPGNGFTESIHGVGKISAENIGTENSDQLVIGGTVTYVREYGHLDSLFVRGTNGDNIEVTDFSFNDATQGNIYVNDVQTSATTQIDITLPSDSTFHGSAYKDNITIETPDPDPYHPEYTTNVTIDGLASGDILTIQHFYPADTSKGWYCKRDMSAGNVLTITQADVDDPILTISDYGTTRGTFTFTGLNPANCHLYVTNANSFDAGQVSDTWGFKDFAIEGTAGSDTLKGGSGLDTFNGHGGHDIFIFEGNFGQDIVQNSTAQDEFHFVGIERSKISYNEGQLLNSISIAGTENTITLHDEVAAPDIIYAVNEAGVFQKYSLQGTFKTAFDVPEGGLTEDVTISDSNYNAINFLNPDFDTSGLTFERTADTLIVSGITEGKTLTITDFNFSSLSNIDYLDVVGSHSSRISDCRIAYDLSGNYTKAFASPYVEDITVANGTTANISGLKSTDTLTLDGTKSRTWSEDAAADKNKLVITNTENNITVTITDYFLGNHDYYPESGELNVTLNDTTNAYACTSFDEVITGKGIVSGATEADILYMGNQCDDAATCVGNDLTFTNGEDISITINGFLNNAGEVAFAGNLCIDGHAYKDKYEHVAYNDKNVAMSERTFFDNSENIFASVNITGTDGNDTYIGGAGNDAIEGGAGNDSILGGDGDDTITGGAGSDTISGGDGDDTITGGAGSDILTGGEDEDTFIFASGDGTDEITDAKDEDSIQFTNQAWADLKFERAGDNLNIKYGETDKTTVTNFFTNEIEDNIDNIIATDAEYSISSQALIGVEVPDDGTYTATEYHELITLSGNATINSAASSDTLKVGVNANALTFDIDGNNLLVKYTVESVEKTVTVTDYITSESKVDSIITTDSAEPHSIQELAVFNVILAQDETFNKETSVYNGLRVNVSLENSATSANITGLKAGDNLNIEAGYALSRTTDASATLTITKDDVTVNITNYDFSAAPAFTIAGAESITALSVTASADYAATDAFVETITVTEPANITNLGNDDKLYTAGAKTFAKNGDSLEIKNNDGDTLATISDIADHHGFSISADGSNYSAITSKVLTVSETSFDGSQGWNGFTQFDITGTSTDISGTLKGGANRDKIQAGDAGDIIWGNGGDDIITGGAGEDKLYYEGDFGRDRVNDLTSDDMIYFTDTARADISFDNDGVNRILRKGDELAGNEITIVNYAGSEDKFDIFYAQNEANKLQAYSLTGKLAFDVPETMTSNVTISNNSYYSGLNFAEGTDIEELNFTRTNDGLLVSGGTLGEYTITITGFNYLAADVTTNVNTLAVNGESISTIAEQLIDYEISGDYEKPAGNLYHERITVADSTNAVISGLDGNDRLNVNGVNSRTWTASNKGKLIITNTEQGITATITDYFTENADHTYYPEEGVLNVTLDDDTNTYEFTGFDEVIGGNGVVSANNLQTTGADTIQTTGENVAYTRVNDGDLVIIAKNGNSTTDNIKVTGFDFGGGHDININGTTTAFKRIDVTLTGGFEYQVTSYAETITGYGSVTGATANTNIYMGWGIESPALCCGKTLAFTYRYQESGPEYCISINDFIDDNGNYDFKGYCYIDGNEVDGKYDYVRFNTIDLEVNDTTTFNNFYNENTLFRTVNVLGTEENDNYTGGEGNDVFDAVTGNDTINFLGENFGNDTVKANSEETLNLIIGGDYTNKEISGDDVILTYTNGTITLDDFAKEDVGATVIANGTNLGEAEYDVTMTSAHYTGKWLNENITGTDENNIIDARDGNDTVDGGTGDDIIFGGTGNDSILGGTGNDSLVGGAGDDTISGGTGNDTIIGGAGNDILDGYKGLNKIIAGELAAQETPGAINIGNDEYVLFNTDGVSINGGDGLDDYDTIYAGGNDNTLNNISGNGGNDEIHLYGGKNNIILPYSIATLENFGVDTVYGATANDTLYFGTNKGTIIGYSFNQLSFERYNTNDLVVYKDSKNQNAVIIKDFFNPENTDSRIDKVITREYKNYSYQLVEHSIKDEVTMTIGLGSNELFVKPDALDGYKLNVTFTCNEYTTRSASVQGLQDCDEVYFDGNVSLSVSGSAMTFNYKSRGIFADKSITVVDFFDENCEFNHNITYNEKSGKVLFTDKDVEVSNTTSFTNEYNYFKSVNITGTDGNDIYKGGNGNDEFNSGDGNDTIYTGIGSDYVDGGDGDDTIIIDGNGNKTVYGGDGDDTFFFDKGSAVLKDTHAGDIIKFATFDFTKIEFARGEGNNINDLLIRSKVEGDNDAIVISNYFAQAENERISTFDIQGIQYTLGWRESTVPDVGSAMYNIISNNDPNPKFIDELRNWVAGENGTGVEVNGRKEFDMLSGTSHSDTISAGINGAEIYGSDGHDELYGSDKNDFIAGGAGNDEIYVGNDRLDADTISFINADSLEPLAFGNDTIYGANFITTLNFAIDMGEEAETRYVGYNATDLKFEKSGTSLIIKARKNANEDYNTAEIKDYFDKKGKVISSSVDEVIALNGSGELSSYSIEALRSTNYIDLSDYDFEDLTFERDMTGDNVNKLVIRHNTDGIVWEGENFFKEKNPVDILLVKNDSMSIKKEIDINVKTDEQNYTGNDYREVVTSSDADEKYNLKTNKDNLILSGNFGKDEITLNDNESLTLTFDNVDEVKRYVLGKDVILEDKNNAENQVILKDFVSKDFKNLNIFVKDKDEEEYRYNLKDVDFDPAIDGTKVTGTKLNESYTSTSADENIDLKTGDDGVLYSKNSITDDGQGNLVGWGKDTIKINKNESLWIDIIEQYVVTKEQQEYVYNISNEYKASGKDLIIVSTATCANPPAGYTGKYNLGTITVAGGLNIDSTSGIFVNDEDLSYGHIDYETGEIITALHYYESDVTKGAINGGQLSDGVDLTNYISEKGTGVKIDTKGGDDVVKGSKYNDTVKSTTGSNRIEEYAGKNTIKTGSGDDQISIEGTSSNTINAGEGSNWVWLTSSGTNKLTVGKGNNYIYATNGNNTIKAGNGGNLVRLQGGINTVTTGTGRDEIIVSDPSSTGAQSVNNIKTGAGADTVTVETMSENIINAGNGGINLYGEVVGNKITLANGINTVTSGKDNDRVLISGGQNIVNTGGGNDNITVSGGTSIVDGAAGDDIYNIDITTFNSSLNINDTKGANVLNLGSNNNERVNLFFDVSTDKKGKAVFGKMKFSINDVIGEDGFSGIDGVDVANKKVISRLEYGNNSFAINASEIDKLAADIASWLQSKPEYASTGDVFANGTAEDINTLVARYTTFADNGYVAG